MQWDAFLEQIAVHHCLSVVEREAFLTRFSEQNLKKSEIQVAITLNTSKANLKKQLTEVYKKLSPSCPELDSQTKGKFERLLAWLRKEQANPSIFNSELKQRGSDLSWRDIGGDYLETQNQRSLKTAGAVSLNPFVPLAGIVDNPQQFFNREEEIERIFDVFNSGGSVALIGEEAIGKSSLLKAICRQAESRLHSPRKPVYLDLNGICDEEDFYSALCHEVGIPESKGYRLTRELRSHRLLLALDNVGKITCEGFSRQVRDQLRGLAEGSDAPLRLLLSTTQPLDSLFEDSQDGNKTSPLAGICQEEYLEAWNETTTRAFIADRLALTAVQFTEEEISQLVQESCGYPQRLMQLCYQTYSRYLEGVQ
ncbi:MAG: ATP-binding protein [Cyanobacteriota bacterium]